MMNAGLEAEALVALSGRVTAGPVLRGDLVLVVLDHKRLAALTPRGEGSRAAWETEEGLVGGRIRGLPPRVEGVLVVSDDRWLLGVSIEDGRCVWRQRLPTRSFSVSAAAAIRKRELLQPLADGTLLVVKLPEAEPLAAKPPASALSGEAAVQEDRAP